MTVFVKQKIILFNYDMKYLFIKAYLSDFSHSSLASVRHVMDRIPYGHTRAFGRFSHKGRETGEDSTSA